VWNAVNRKKIKRNDQRGCQRRFRR
jgi:hypothetical protein